MSLVALSSLAFITEINFLLLVCVIKFVVCANTDGWFLPLSISVLF